MSSAVDQIGLGPAERRETLSTRTYGALRARIISTSLAPGAALSEVEVARSLGVSRTPVREAFVRLLEEGLIGISSQTGTRVSLVDMRRVRDAAFIRASLESAVVRAGREMPAAGLQALDANLLEQKYAVRRADFVELHRLDMAFHQMLMEGFGQPLAWSACQFVSADLERVQFLLGWQQSHLQSLLDEHRVIFGHVEAGRTADAAEALKAHIENVDIDQAILVAKSPSFFIEER
jgi:DNA-binding GntR family transcriptional regulator